MCVSSGITFASPLTRREACPIYLLVLEGASKQAQASMTNKEDDVTSEMG